jgi:hypothetical protein
MTMMAVVAELEDTQETVETVQTKAILLMAPAKVVVVVAEYIRHRVAALVCLVKVPQALRQ